MRHFKFSCLLGATVAALVFGSAEAVEERHQHAMSERPVRVELGSTPAFGPDGALYVASKRGEHVVVERSSDLAQTWDAPRVVNADPEAISADGENRPKIAFARDGSLLVSWTKPLSKPYAGEIRFARADDGKNFSAPITVHQDRREITHRFESMAVGQEGQILIAWVDKRDLEASGGKKDAYRGAAIYATTSLDGGRSFQTEHKVADHSCECCRIAIAHAPDGALLLLWRHVFAPNERDHAMARLNPDGTPASVQRATFDHWKIDACPHHGPSLVVDENGVRHAVWFNMTEGKAPVHYGRLIDRGNALVVEGQISVGGPRAAHADIASAAGRLGIVWKEFDGERTNLYAMLSSDGGKSFRTLPLAATAGGSDQPRIIRRQATLFAFWRTENEGFRVIELP